jgi:hypothetical protein
MCITTRIVCNKKCGVRLTNDIAEVEHLAFNWWLNLLAITEFRASTKHTAPTVNHQI